MTGGLLLLLGVLLALGSAALPTMGWMLSASSCVALALFTPLRRRASLRHLALLLLGLVLAWVSTLQWLQLRVPAPAPDSRLLFEGRIVSVPAREGTELHFDVAGVILDGAGPRDTRTRRSRLTWRDAPAAPRAGERWRFLVQLAPSADTRNFAGADPARFLFRDRVHLVGRVLPSTLNERVAPASASIDTLRSRIAARIREQVADPDAGALLIALAVGLTDRLSADQWRVFNATGTTHLVAISGLHVTLFALVAFFIARIAWTWLTFTHRMDREPFALLLGLAAAGAYSLLAGFSVPTQRTWLMLAVVAIARLAARHVASSRIWTLALMAVLILDPFAPLSAGFWLSFVAVGVILCASAASTARVWAVVRLQLAIMLALAPLTFAVFDGLSIAGLWVNLAAIPLVSFVLVPLVLAGALATLAAPALSGAFFGAAATLYEWSWPALTWAADTAFAMWRVTPPLWWFGFALAASLVTLRRWPVALRCSGACALLPLLFAPGRLPEPGAVRVSILDAGRGAAVLLITHSHVLLYDTGDSWHTRGARLRQTVFPALDVLGHDSVDLLVLPALNDDRAHAAALLAFERRVRGIRVGGGWPGSSLPAARCADSKFQWDGVRFETWVAGAGERYCALRVSVGTHAILLAGDLDRAAERGLVSRLARGELVSDAVLMSRQASSLGSAPEWIEASAARLAIATGGIAHSYSRDATLERWRRAGAEVLDTRIDGGIELGLGTAGVNVLVVARVARYPFVWRRLQ